MLSLARSRKRLARSTQVISASSRADQTGIRRIQCNKFTVLLPIDIVATLAISDRWLSDSRRSRGRKSSRVRAKS